MARISFFVALLALIISIVALFFAIGKGPQVVHYTITGDVEVVNDCDGLQASIPAQIKVKTSLNGPNNVSSSGVDLVNLLPDPNDPANTPRKIGSYSIRVAWTPSTSGVPTTWDWPVATTNGGQRICGFAIQCPVGSGLCLNVAQGVRGIAFNAAGNQQNFAVNCDCR